MSTARFSARHIDVHFWIILIAALALRGGLVLLYPYLNGGGDQGLHYVNGVFVSRIGTAPLGVWAPGYETLLGATFALFGPTPFAARIAQVFLSTFSVGFVYGIAKSGGGQRAGRIAGWLCALYPSLVFYPQYLYSETLYIFILMAAIYAFVRMRKGSRVDIVVVGILFGLSILTRSVAVWFFPCCVAWEWLRGRPLGARRAAGIFIVAMLIVLPWSARNYAKYGDFLLVDGTMGRTLYHATSESKGTGLDLNVWDVKERAPGRSVRPKQKRANSEKEPSAFPEPGGARNREPCPEMLLEHVEPLPAADVLETWFPQDTSLAIVSKWPRMNEEYLFDRLRSKIARAEVRARLDLVAQQRCETPRALEAVANRPMLVVEGSLKRAYRFWGPNSYVLRAVHRGVYKGGPLTSYPALKWLVVLTYCGVIVLAILSLGRRPMPSLVEWSALFVTYYFALHSVAAAHSRYRLPIMPILIVLAALWLADPRWPDGRIRTVQVGALLLGFLALSVHYVATFLP